uniref:Trehalase n=1 Tax=Globodera pallida TaxID=36090 RepID=A0A183BQN2_GLOPA
MPEYAFIFFLLLPFLPLLLPPAATAPTFYLKTQFEKNDGIVEKDVLNCSLNGIDLTGLGLERNCEQWPDLAPIFCDGKIIEAVNYWGARMLFLRDSKHFVDRPLLKEPKKVVEQFKTRFNVTEWKQFVLIDRFGFVPAGNRIYYSKRSQPPFLTLMIYDYFGATGDAKFLKEMLPILEKELDFWRTKRSVEVIVKGKKKTFYQYKADTNVSRWIRKDEADKASPWKLTNLMTTRIVPMDLNALMCGNMEMLAHLYLQIGDKAKSRAYHGKYQLFMEDFKSLFYKKEHGIWYDYNMDSGTLNEAFYGSAAMPLFVRCYDTIDLGTAERMFQRLELFDKQHKLLGHPFGVPVSITVNSSQQWDFPNILPQWDFPNILPPSQHMLIEGLRRSSNRRMEEKAKEMAQKWVFANYNRFQNCLRQMWEKITADTGTPGSGGEYNAQMGFGWTNGAMLDLLVTYGDVLKLEGVPEIRCSLKDLVQEPEQYPNNVSEYRAQRFMEEQKEVDEINRSQKYWTAVVYEKFALMTEQELRYLYGVPKKNRTHQPKLQFKQAVEPIDYGDLPNAFDARQKWPECADFIGTTTDQGQCGSCWAVSAASTFTDRICIARLKKGIKTDSKDPRAYVSAQYTLECAPTVKGKGCKGKFPIKAWKLYRENGTVSGTDHAMLSGCKPYIIQSMSETEKNNTPCKKECDQKWFPKQCLNSNVAPLPSVPHGPFLIENVHMPAAKDTVHWSGENDPNREPKMMRELMTNGTIQAIFQWHSDFEKCGKNGVHEPEDWKENPQKFDQIKDAELKKWAYEMHKMWKKMSKKMASIMDSKGNQQKHSMLYVSNPFMVPGGRFRELRYWDSYWIVRGLLASGMTSSVRNICKNFAELIDRFGFVPAGNRIFYSKRSQPPFLTLMVYDYFGATGDAKFLKEMLPILEKELDFWRTKRSVEVIVKGKKKSFYQYKADTNVC